MGRPQMYTTLRVAVLLTRTPKLVGYCQTNEFVLEIRWSTRYVLQCHCLFRADGIVTYRISPRRSTPATYTGR